MENRDPPHICRRCMGTLFSSSYRTSKLGWNEEIKILFTYEELLKSADGGCNWCKFAVKCISPFGNPKRILTIKIQPDIEGEVRLQRLWISDSAWFDQFYIYTNESESLHNTVSAGC